MTPSELAILKQVNLHRRLTSPLHFLSMLHAIRQAVQGVEVAMTTGFMPATRLSR